ncbi:uncharacterized protein LOC110984678 [Acanthaster planci]|uniref:Uncharacterized protein LOC110984678 n=1 Tax=Acanthaster planci TaxID=133434 RepID=A0A8B7Z575_ACAPL|nr:uncharacterized protein LOC110984678 [Acanthaster planci]
MPRQKQWWFEMKNGRAFVMCSNSRLGEDAKPILQSNKMPYGAVKKLEVYKPSSSPADSGQSGKSEQNEDMIKIIFYEGNPKVLPTRNFLWQINDFCRNLRPSRESLYPTLDIVERFNSNIPGPSTEIDDDDSSPTGDDSATMSSSLDDEDLHTVTQDSIGDVQTDDSAISKKRRKLDNTINVPPLLNRNYSTSAQAAVPPSLSIQYKQEVQNAHLGHVKIYLKNLELGKQIRPVDKEFVAGLQTQMEKFPLDSTYQPLCVVTKTLPSPDMFKEENANGFKYGVIGGQHNFLATKALHDLYPERELYKSRWCSVYYGAISNEALLYLANTHNVIGRYRHEMTFKDKLQMCRLMMQEQTTSKDNAWKRKCSAILHEDMSGHFMRVLIHMAAQEETLYQSLMRVLSKYEKGELKDQALRKKERATGELDIKPYVFRPFLSLPASALSTLLTQLEKKEINLGTLQREGVILQKLQRVQRQMIFLLDARSWEELETKFPEHTTREVLFQYTKGLKGKEVSDSLRQFCRGLSKKAKLSTEEGTFLTEAPFQGVNRVVGFHLTMDVSNIKANSITELCGDFPGFQLTVLDLPKSWDEVSQDGFWATVIDINTKLELPSFTVAVLCKVAQQENVKKHLMRTDQFQEVETCYYHVADTKPEVGKLTESVFGIVIGHHGKTAVDRWASCQKRCNLILVNRGKTYKTEDGAEIDPGQKAMALYQELIRTYSAQQQWVLNACSRTGTGLLACMAESRNCVSVDRRADSKEHLQTRYNALGVLSKAKKAIQQPQPQPSVSESEDVWSFDSTFTDDELLSLSN